MKMANVTWTTAALQILDAYCLCRDVNLSSRSIDMGWTLTQRYAKRTAAGAADYPAQLIEARFLFSEDQAKRVVQQSFSSLQTQHRSIAGDIQETMTADIKGDDLLLARFSALFGLLDGTTY